MAALVVVVPDVLDDRAARLLARGEVFSVHTLDLEGSVERLHGRVVPAIALAAHRHRNAERLELLSVIVGRVLGEFNPSSQHIEGGCCDEYEKEAIESKRECEDALARPAACSASIAATAILGGDRRRVLERRGRTTKRGLTGGWDEMVSGVRRNAAITSLPVGAAADGAILVLGRTRADRFVARSTARGTRDRAATCA